MFEMRKKKKVVIRERQLSKVLYLGPRDITQLVEYFPSMYQTLGYLHLTPQKMAW